MVCLSPSDDGGGWGVGVLYKQEYSISRQAGETAKKMFLSGCLCLNRGSQESVTRAAAEHLLHSQSTPICDLNHEDVYVCVWCLPSVG